MMKTNKLKVTRGGMPFEITQQVWDSLGPRKNGLTLVKAGSPGSETPQDIKAIQYKAFMNSGKELLAAGNFAEALPVLLQAQKLNDPKYLQEMIARAEAALENDNTEYDSTMIQAKEAISIEDWATAKEFLEAAESLNAGQKEVASLIKLVTKKLK